MCRRHLKTDSTKTTPIMESHESRSATLQVLGPRAGYPVSRASSSSVWALSPPGHAQRLPKPGFWAPTEEDLSRSRPVPGLRASSLEGSFCKDKGFCTDRALATTGQLPRPLTCRMFS